MTAQCIDQLLALGEKLKNDVEESGKRDADIFLAIWSSIELKLLEEDFDLVSAREPKNIVDLSVREGLVDIGRCYLAEDARLPNDRNIAEQWLAIGAELGSLMGQMLLFHGAKFRTPGSATSQFPIKSLSQDRRTQALRVENCSIRPRDHWPFDQPVLRI